jgi:hypothetical protein
VSRRPFWSRSASWAAVGLVGAALVLTACTGARSSSRATNPWVVSAGSGSSGCGPRMPAGAVAPGTTQNRTLSAGAIAGSYWLTVAHSHRPGSRMPLLFLFFGFGSDPLPFSALTHLPSQAASDGYLVPSRPLQSTPKQTRVGSQVIRQQLVWVHRQEIGRALLRPRRKSLLAGSRSQGIHRTHYGVGQCHYPGLGLLWSFRDSRALMPG